MKYVKSDTGNNLFTCCHSDLKMVDSVKVVNEDVLRRIHANYAGRLHKGMYHTNQYIQRADINSLLNPKYQMLDEHNAQTGITIIKE